MGTTFFISVGVFAVLFAVLAFSSIRNEWVFKHRAKLIDYHYGSGEYRRMVQAGDHRSFDERYGTYNEWVWNNWYQWDPGKISGTDWAEVTKETSP